MAQLQRTGRVNFHDASLSVWEDGLYSGMPYAQRDAWETTFKRQVFSRIVQQMRRLGWTVKMPDIDAHAVKQYGGHVARWSAERKRFCTKGELKADLEINGRAITFNMFQNVNAPDRPDNDGRYQYDKEKHMPYRLRLEMERTRRRIRNYLCNVFAGYTFQPDRPKLGPNGVTALEYAAHDRQSSGHYIAELDRARIGNTGEDISADGHQLENGTRVYAMLHNGRMVAGTAFYSLNGQWQIVTGRYAMHVVYCKSIWIDNPGNLRQRRDRGQRRKRLESELSSAIKAMNFERAAVLRDILFPKDEPLYVVWHSGHNVYHRTGFAGYTANIIDAGKFTAAEALPWNKAPNEVRPLEQAA